MLRNILRISVDKYTSTVVLGGRQFTLKCLSQTEVLEKKNTEAFVVRQPSSRSKAFSRPAFPATHAVSSSFKLPQLLVNVILRIPMMSSLITAPKGITSTRDISPPKSVRGMVTLDREKFKQKVYVPGILVSAQGIRDIVRHFNSHLLRLTKVQPFVDLSDDDPNVKKSRVMLLDPQQHPTKDSFTEEESDMLKSKGADPDTWQLYELDMEYENWNGEDIFKAVLPIESEGFSSYTVIGHIAHLNLKDALLDYKHLIGQVLIDKFKTIKTVVNKTNTIDNTFRNFQMEVIAGEDNFITTAKENGCQYKMDFSKVYWNSRLGTEHERIVKLLKPGDKLYDVFAGIGPFAVPAGKKKCTVLANDLNPESHKWLQENLKLNKVGGQVQTYNLDGREFIRTVAKADLVSWYREDKYPLQSVHFVMNLPAMALEFLDSFKGLLSGHPTILHENSVLPMVYCYCFSNASDHLEDIRERVATYLSKEVAQKVQIRFVRNVAPKKDMYCVIFQLDKCVLLWEGENEETGNSEECEPERKKSKHEDTVAH
ncbi:tRNA (guanine(37)-N1)-methyltransferase [Lingula anatina]|uniref:tRNA (guanine(37)-N1)-methyltransferase n=1 Tax=Lingula anatina TaxID=7574 RepID=A0A1S3IL28_LINAN|nr:tRNA (guanine(37)-N1)-methyltransferase [Lingula anatina]|eukprot:XP_013398950.1 tRNA (guanine(37)-N1)-methyltransferase [Lingula anatina]